MFIHLNLIFSRCMQVVMWLNQNFLLPEGVDSPEVTFNSLRGGGLLSISMASNGQVHADTQNNNHTKHRFKMMCF